MSRLVLDNLTLRRDGVCWIDLRSDKPLTIEPGELFGVLGREGSGKTTLARLIVGLDRPDEGQILLNDRPIADRPPDRRGTALVWDDDTVWPDRSVEENISFALHCRRLNRKARRMRVGEILPLLGLDGLGHLPAGSLSPLQQWSVCLGRALASEPDLLVIDEPFDHTSQREETRDLIRRIHVEQRLTTILLSRRASHLAALVDRLAILAVGRPLQIDTPFEIYTRPVSLEVAQLLGPGNTFPGQVETVDPRGTVVVRTAVGRLMGRARPGVLRVGDAAHVFVRPEALGLGPSPGMQSNRFAAVLTRRVFLGSHCRLELEGPGAWTGSVIALPPAALPLREGQSLTVSVAPEWVIVLPS